MSTHPQEVHDELMLAYVVRKAFVALRTGFIYRGSTESAINPNIWWRLIDYAIYLTDHDFVHTRG